MPTLSQTDPTVDIACTLPINDARDRLSALQSLIGDALQDATIRDGRLRIRIGRSGRADLDDVVAKWAAEEKSCCAFLGFAMESQPDTVTLEISAPAGAEPTLHGIEWVVRAAGRLAST